MAEPRSVSEPGRASFTLIFLRACLCVLAFALASLAASAVGTFGLYRGLEGDTAYGIAYVTTVFLGTFFLASMAFLPFAAFALLTEALALRSVLLCAVFGAVLGGVFAWQEAVEFVGLEDRRLLVSVAAGIVGGVVYWLVAGRSAGAYRERRYGTITEPGSPEA